MGDIQGNDHRIAGISVRAKVEFLPAVLDFVREISTKLGLDSAGAQRLELATEEACMNVIEHAFDLGESGAYDVMVERKPGQVKIIVEDIGLPFNISKLESEKGSGTGTMIMKAFTDEIHFHNLGRKGKRVELVKNLNYRDVDSYISEKEKQQEKDLSLIPGEIPIEYRAMTPADAVNLARCVYRSYGYTYANDKLYYPDRVVELLESGVLTSYIAIAPDGEIIGHEAISRESPNARIGEIGMAVVDPRYRGRGIQQKLGNLLKADALQRGMLGTFAEVVSVHPYAQKTVLSHSGRETGILLGFIPATMFFKKIEKEGDKKRQAVVLFYTRANDEPMRTVYPPFHHQTIIRRIYEANNFKRNIIGGAEAAAKLEIPAVSQVDVKSDIEKGFGFMRVLQYGDDIGKLVKFRLQELCLRRIDAIYIDLPLCDPATQRFCAAIEAQGFFFGGVLPELIDGDVLRLQYMNNVEIDVAGTQIASEFGKELFDYVIKAKEA
jgi:anti-sigma regulatory factor (Ser/Thr protein kinase)/GNAT superfamily N-acetyltransferase